MEKVIETAQLFHCTSPYVLLFFVSSAVLGIVYKKDLLLRRRILYPILGAALCVFNPLVIEILSKLVKDPKRYVRLYWLFPLVIVLAITAVKAGDLALESRRKRWIIYAAAAVLFVFSGTCLLTKENFPKAENVFKIPQEAIDICEMLPEDTSGIRIVVPPSLSCYIRQYDGNVKMPYGRHRENSTGELFDLMSEIKLNIPEIIRYARLYDCDYIVLETVRAWSDDAAAFGYEWIGQSGNYVLYRDGE